MRKTAITILLATALTIGGVYAAGFLTPSGGSSSGLIYSYISTANSTTTLNSSGPGFINGIVFGTTPVSSSTTVTIFDGTVASNTIIAKFVLTDGANPIPSFDLLGVRYLNGLTVQETGATTSLTIAYQ